MTTAHRNRLDEELAHRNPGNARRWAIAATVAVASLVAVVVADRMASRHWAMSQQTTALVGLLSEAVLGLVVVLAALAIAPQQRWTTTMGLGRFVATDAKLVPSGVGIQ